MKEYDSFCKFNAEFNKIIIKCNACIKNKNELLDEREIRKHFFDALDINSRILLHRDCIESGKETTIF